MNDKPQVAIVDYALGNLYSVRQACLAAGMDATITSLAAEIEKADAVILPGVGAFGDAMAALRRLGLIELLRDLARTDRPVIGICLGQQLLMSESHEFGVHRGLDIVPGTVRRFEQPKEGEQILKVPQVGWNQIVEPKPGAWKDCPAMDGIHPGEYVYFVHSYHVIPEDRSVWLCSSKYGHIEFCSALTRGSVIGFQFHPERSGPAGLQIYRNLARMISERQTAYAS